MADEERRAHPRHDLFAQVHVKHGSVTRVLDILNLSRGGALVDLGRRNERWMTVGQALEIHVLDAEGRTVLGSAGTVVRIAKTPDGWTLAMRFDALLDDDTVRRVLREAGRPPPLPMPTGA